MRSRAILFILALSLVAARGSAQGTTVQCIATSTANGQVTIYVSQMIPMSGGTSPAINNAWGEYVKASYKLDNLATAVCNPMSADPSVQQRVLSAEQNAWQRKNMNVVQVTWQMGGQRRKPASDTNPYATPDKPDDAAAKPDAKAAPADKPADADAVPSGPPPRASYCYSDDKKPTVYFSDPFDTQGLPSPAAWQKAFGAMLAQKYSYKGIVTCKDKGTFVDVQSAILEQKDGMQGKQLIDTDWSYEPPAAPQN